MFTAPSVSKNIHIATPAMHTAALSIAKIAAPKISTATKIAKVKAESMKSQAIKGATIKPVNMKTPMVKFGAQMKTSTKAPKSISLKVPAIHEAMASLGNAKINTLKGTAAP